MAPGGISVAGFALLLGLSFFLGLAFEDVFMHAGARRPGGIRTFPMLAIIGGALYAVDPQRLVPFAAGLVVLGAWLLVYYREHIHESDETGVPNVGLMVSLLNLYAYVLGAIALALPHWVAVGTTVAAVLLFAGRARLHALAQRVELKEIVTAAQFLLLTGLVLPLLPDTPATSLTAITPRDAWLALLVVCTLSYASYLLQRYVVPKAGGWATAALGGLYSSTATTVVLAREAVSDPAIQRQAQAGITLATAIMYLRILAVVAVFNFALARSLAPVLAGFSALALAIAAAQYRLSAGHAAAGRGATSRNPLELGPAALFALLFVTISVLTKVVTQNFGHTGIDVLAAVVGVSDIDPFVLNLAQGGAPDVPARDLTAAIVIAASSNNLLKAGYAAAFAGWRASLPAVAALALLALSGFGVALVIGGVP